MYSSLRKRISSLFIPTLILVVLIPEIWTTPIYTDRDLTAIREAAVALAKQGDGDTALERLRALSEVAPDNRAVWGDYLSVLVRTGHDQQALTLYRNNGAKALPDYTLAELFDAALRQHDVVLARQIADREIAQSQNREAITAARAQALNDSGLLAAPPAAEHDAAQIAALATVAAPGSVQQPAASNKAAAVAANVQVSRNRTTNAQAGTRQVSRSFAPQAESVTPTPIAPNESRLLADEVRTAVRAAEQAPAAERAMQAEAALPLIGEYEASLAAGSIELRNAKLDHVRALTLANRLDEAAALFESLGPTEQMPLYGVMNGADLYARRHQPERVKTLLDQAERMQADSRGTLLAQFYNQLDMEQFDRAATTLSRLRGISRDAISQRDTEIIAAMFAAYQNHLDEAQQRLERLRDASPDNGEIQLRLAQIYRWRGWPRRALIEYQLATKNLDDGVPAQVGEVAARNDLHAFQAAHQQLRQLAESTPTHPDVVQALQEQAQRDRWAYSAQILAGQSSGSPVTGSGDIAFDQKLYAPPLDDHLRAFVHQRYDWANFPEGNGSANRLGIGGDYRSPSFDVAAEISDRIPGGHLGAAVSGEWKFDDHFSAFGEVQTDSTQIPLRALRAEIDGHSMTAGAQYRADESHAARASYSRTDFSDGNKRDAIAAQYQQSIYRDAHNQLSAIAQGYYGRNSAGNDVPYFNPDSETSIGAAVIYDGILWRRYQRSWSQRLQFGAGNYSQQHFGSGAIWDVEYEQRWQLSDALNFNYGALYRSRIYDGGREGYSAVFGGVNWRF